MRTSVELFKSVILRTKSFKVFILLILVISCLIIQLNNNNENIIDNKISEDENSLFDDHDDYEKPGLEIDLNNPYAGITKDESSSNDAKETVGDSALQNIQSNMDDLESEIVGQVNEKKFEARKEKFQSILGDTKLELSEGTDLVKKGMQVFDQFVHTDSESYHAIKAMIELWNPEGSKWAAQISRNYKMDLDLDDHGARDPKPIEWFEEPKIDGRVKKMVEVDRCGCQREILSHTMMTYDNDKNVNKSISTCAHHSFERGAKQKVVAFSFYGNPNSAQSKERKYFEGIRANLNELPKHYPDWTLRLYYDLPKDHYLMKELCDLACNDPNLDLCYVEQIPALGNVSKAFAMNWRFFPMLDPQVSHMVSRDLDSLLNDREGAAVQEWLKSDKAFHFMRDHPAHGIEILGSGWGVRMSPLEKSYVDSAFSVGVKDPLFWAPRDAYGPDQGFLKRYIWPWGKWSALSHDSYTCQKFPRTQAFPTQRILEKNNFVAAVISANDVLLEECPEKCRPKNHPDWKYC